MTDLTRKDIQAALSRLGTTSDEIAESLQIKQCTGYRSSAASCPIAHYLTEQFPGNRFSVSESACAPIGHGLDWIDHDFPVSHFIRRFDRGLYPDLIA